MFCTQCGKEVPVHYKFCQNCGAPVITAKSAEAPEILPVDVTATNETPVTVSSTKKKDKPKKSRKKLLLLCGIPVLAVLIFVGFFIIKNVTAKETVVDGLRYRAIDSYNASLIAVEDSSLLPRRLEIPSHVEIGSKTYDVYEIGMHAFEDCEDLIRVELPKTIEVIDSYAFSNCTSLKQVDLPSRLLLLYDNAFSGCTSLTEITLPDSLSFLSAGTFSDCTSLKEFIIPDSITTIESGAFKGCSSLRRVIIPDSVQTIGYDAFGDCTNLSEVIVPYNLASDFELLQYKGVTPYLNIIYWEQYNN